MLPAESDALGAAGAADTAKRDRAHTAPADVQLAQPDFTVQAEAAADAASRLRGWR